MPAARPRIRVGPLSLGFAIVAGCLSFNAVLSLLNANLFGVTRAHVVGAEVVLVGMALGTSLLFWRREMGPWLGLLWFVCVLGLCLGVFRQSFDPKLLRDVILIPTFVMLGIAVASQLRDFKILVRFVAGLQVLVVAVMLLEAVAPAAFADVLGVQSYYVNTRDFTEENFWNEDSDLFVSATRPGDRFWFNGIDVHRLSSIFLEPVSLGNWAILITIFAAAFFGRMRWGMRLFFGVSIFAVLVGSDGRLATVTCALIAATSWAYAYLPRYFHVLYLPMVLAGTFLVVHLFGFEPGADNFAGRMAHTVALFSDFSLLAYLGLDDALRGPAADSGIAYLMLTQSAIGLMVIWIWISLAAPGQSAPSRTYVHGLLLYLALTMMVSYSLFSIKTAAFAWFLVGVCFFIEIRSQLRPLEERAKLITR